MDKIKSSLKKRKETGRRYALRGSEFPFTPRTSSKVGEIKYIQESTKD